MFVGSAYIRLQHRHSVDSPHYCLDEHERFNMLFRKQMFIIRAYRVYGEVS